MRPSAGNSRMGAEHDRRGRGAGKPRPRQERRPNFSRPIAQAVTNRRRDWPRRAGYSDSIVSCASTIRRARNRPPPSPTISSHWIQGRRGRRAHRGARRRVMRKPNRTIRKRRAASRAKSKAPRRAPMRTAGETKPSSERGRRRYYYPGSEIRPRSRARPRPVKVSRPRAPSLRSLNSDGRRLRVF